MGTIDFHTHILPELDDGSKSLDESLVMMHTMKDQGVDEILATSHFYAFQNDPMTFLQKRNASLERLKAALPEGSPMIRPGAEVYLFEGISKSEEVSLLRVEGTKLLLLEMPFETWSDRMLMEVLELSARREIVLLLAHIERYFPYQNKKIWRELRERGIHMQVNASYLLDRRTRRKALKLIGEGVVEAVGTDCHNMDSRPPCMGEAVSVLQDYKRGRFAEEFFFAERRLLEL